MATVRPSCAQEWTRFRGPNGTGISLATTIPTEYTDATRNWVVKLPGVGHSSPVIWGNKVFVTSAEETTGKRHLHCVNVPDGKILWTHTFDFTAYSHHRFNNAAASTPVVDAEMVYLPWSSPTGLTLHALDHTGKEVWKADLGKWDGAHGGASSPILVGDVLIMRNDSDGAKAGDPAAPECFITGLDRKTGKILWKQPRIGKDASYSSPVVHEPKDGPAEVIFTSNSHGFSSLNPMTGEINWEVPSVFTQRCVSTPVVANGLIFGTAGNGGGARQAVAVRPGSKKAGVAPKIEFQMAARGVPYVPTPIVLGDRMFLWGDNGVVACAKAATGEMVWMERVGGNFFGSPVCVNGKLYAISASGELVVVEASDEFKVLGRSSLGEASHSTPAVSGGVMYLRTESQLISFGGKK